MTDDLIVTAEDGDWTFPATVSVLPVEAREMRLGHMIGAPRMEYIRGDVHEAAIAKASHPHPGDTP